MEVRNGVRDMRELHEAEAVARTQVPYSAPLRSGICSVFTAASGPGSARGAVVGTRGGGPFSWAPARGGPFSGVAEAAMPPPVGQGAVLQLG